MMLLGSNLPVHELRSEGNQACAGCGHYVVEAVLPAPGGRGKVGRRTVRPVGPACLSHVVSESQSVAVICQENNVQEVSATGAVHCQGQSLATQPITATAPLPSVLVHSAEGS